MSYPKSVTFTQARNFIAQSIQSKTLHSQLISIKKAMGYPLADDICAASDVPAWDCSRVDGYAFDIATMNQHIEAGLQVEPAIFAGDNTTAAQKGPVAYPVMTGAVLPDGTDTVAMKEQVTLSDSGQLKLSQKVDKGQFIRGCGTDVRKGQTVLKKGRRLRPEDLGLLASVGVGSVPVFQRPKALVLTTGDELVAPGQHCQIGQVYDANSYMIRQQLACMGCDVLAVKHLKDSKEATVKVMNQLKSKSIDLVLSIGGVSMGDKDFIPSALNEVGEVIFHKVGVKPGFPLLFGKLGQSIYFGLPGNPVSSFTAVCQFVWYAIRMFQGEMDVHNLNWRGKLTHDVNKSHYRREFMRGYYVQSYDGSIDVTVCGDQQSSRIRSLVEANCFVVLDESQQDIKSGELVRIQPYHQFNIF